MTEICNDMLIKELWELKSKTCNTMWAKENGCENCKFHIDIVNRKYPELHSEMCLITLMNCTINTPDVRKIKGVF